jgi:hypothetical protein
MTNLHEIEELEFGRDGGLWDADPDVCCAAFQLGACAHTESYVDDQHDEDVAFVPAAPVAAVVTAEEPF